METYLAHHGILGMKCGIRRYQNKDGSLTDTGKKRYADSESMYKSESKKTAKNGAKTISIGAASGLFANAASNALQKKSFDNFVNAGKTNKKDHILYSFSTGNDIASNFTNIARGAVTVASIISGVGNVSVLSSAAISAGQLAYSAYLKHQAKKAASASGNSKET